MKTAPIVILSAIILSALMLAGCATEEAESTNTVDVYVNNEGGLWSDHYSLKKDDLASFAKEVGDKTIVVRPGESNGGEVDFGKVVAARDALKAAGAKDVKLDIKNGS